VTGLTRKRAKIAKPVTTPKKAGQETQKKNRTKAKMRRKKAVIPAAIALLVEGKQIYLELT